MDAHPPHWWAHSRLTAVLRRRSGSRPTTPPGPPDSGADLVADIVVMTAQAAVDGLSLSSVLEDVRLVLELEPDAPLPLDALRACALEWARASRYSGPAFHTDTVTLDDLEGRLWRLMGDSPDELPGRVVVVRLPSPRAADAGTEVPLSTAVLGSTDLLLAAAQVLSSVFDRPDDYVALLRSTSSAVPDRVVALVPDPVDDTTGVEDRVALAEATLASAPVVGVVPWVVEIHLLAGHPEGLLARIREALDPA